MNFLLRGLIVLLTCVACLSEGILNAQPPPFPVQNAWRGRWRYSEYPGGGVRMWRGRFGNGLTDNGLSFFTTLGPLLIQRIPGVNSSDANGAGGNGASGVVVGDYEILKTQAELTSRRIDALVSARTGANPDIGAIDPTPVSVNNLAVLILHESAMPGDANRIAASATFRDYVGKHAVNRFRLIDNSLTPAQLANNPQIIQTLIGTARQTAGFRVPWIVIAAGDSDPAPISQALPSGRTALAEVLTLLRRKGGQ